MLHTDYCIARQGSRAHSRLTSHIHDSAALPGLSNPDPRQQVKEMTVIRLHDDAFVQGAFEVPANSFDSFTMLPLGVMGTPGALMNSIGLVRSSGLFQEEEFANDLTAIEGTIKVRRAWMTRQQLGGTHRRVVAFHIGTRQSKVIKNGLDESFLGHVNCAIWFVFNVDSKEIFNAIL